MIVKKNTSNKIRILHLLQGLYMGGAEILVVHYIQALGIDNYDHFVYYFDSDGPARKRFEDIGVPVYGGLKKPHIKQPIRFVADLLSLVKNLLSFIRSNRIQIIQSHLNYANQLAVLVGKISGLPAFPTLHSTMAFLDRRSSLDLRVYLRKMIDAVIYRIADRIIAVSSEIKEIIQQHFGLKDSKIIVVKNGILFNDKTIGNTNLESEIPISGNKLKLIAVGSLSYHKNFESLVRAVDIVVKQGFEDFLLLIIGEGEKRVPIEELISELNLTSHIKLLGIRHDVIVLMRTSDIFVMPSRYEGLSIAMIEAMACALPIIASDAPGLMGHIDQEENGLTFQVGNNKALAENILRLAEDEKLREKLSRGARKSFETEYDMRKNIKLLDSLFQQYCIHN